MHQDGINEQPDLSFTPKQITQRLHHQILPGKFEKDALRLNQLAQISDAVGNGHRPADINDEIPSLASHGKPQRGYELTPIVDQVDMKEGERPGDLVMIDESHSS